MLPPALQTPSEPGARVSDSPGQDFPSSRLGKVPGSLEGLLPSDQAPGLLSEPSRLVSGKATRWGQAPAMLHMSGHAAHVRRRCACPAMPRLSGSPCMQH